MTGLVCLTIALICALIARALLFIAALRISVWWALGIFVPFGPLFFRLSYPDEARSSFIFRMATVVCVFLYFVSGPAAYVSPLHTKPATDAPSQKEKGYASEWISKIFRRTPAETKPVDTRTVEERRVDNEREFERLNRWNQSLQTRKRDLLRSDVEGNQAYAIDLQEYNTALAAANAEKQALATATPAR